MSQFSAFARLARVLSSKDRRVASTFVVRRTSLSNRLVSHTSRGIGAISTAAFVNGIRSVRRSTRAVVDSSKSANAVGILVLRSTRRVLSSSEAVDYICITSTHGGGVRRVSAGTSSKGNLAVTTFRGTRSSNCATRGLAASQSRDGDGA